MGFLKKTRSITRIPSAMPSPVASLVVKRSSTSPATPVGRFYPATPTAIARDRRDDDDDDKENGYARSASDSAAYKREGTRDGKRVDDKDGGYPRSASDSTTTRARDGARDEKWRAKRELDDALRALKEEDSVPSAEEEEEDISEAADGDSKAPAVTRLRERLRREAFVARSPAGRRRGGGEEKYRAAIERLMAERRDALPLDAGGEGGRKESDRREGGTADAVAVVAGEAMVDLDHAVSAVLREGEEANGISKKDDRVDRDDRERVTPPSSEDDGEARGSSDGEARGSSKKGDEDDDAATADTASSSHMTESSDSSCRGSAKRDERLAAFLNEMEGFATMERENQLLVQVEEHGLVDKLVLKELDYVPKPKRAEDIVIKVEASTITLKDCMIRRGKWYEMHKLPFVPGSDFVGTIHSMGYKAAVKSPWKVGDKVAAVVPSGGNAKYITLPYHGVIRVPQDADSVAALCVTSTYFPARDALNKGRKRNAPFTNANILVIGGNGPIGLAAVELALMEGASVFATADERHHEFLAKLGARCFPNAPSEWLPSLRGRMDVVLDSVCMDGYESSRAALNPAGKLVCTGMSAVYTQGQIPAFLMKDTRDIKAACCKWRVNNLWKDTVYYDRMERYRSAPNEYAQNVSYLCHLAAKGTIRPLVSARVPLNSVAATQKAIEGARAAYGVCVCEPWTTKTLNKMAADSAIEITRGEDSKKADVKDLCLL